jgi:hypothetical protein
MDQPPSIPLDSVLTKTDLKGFVVLSPSNDSPQVKTNLINEIMNRYNIHGNNCFTESFIRGDLVSTDKFLLATYNNQPEIMALSNEKIARKLYPFNPWKKVKLIGTYNQTDLVIGINGSYILNVPDGKYAKGWMNNNAVLYDSGVHIIHNPMFQKNRIELVNKNEEKIVHDHILILNNPAMYSKEDKKIGMFIKLGNDGYILKSRSEPYVFNILGKVHSLQYFDPSKDVFEYGKFKRILVKPKRKAITYDEGKKIIHQPQDKAIIITSENHTFKKIKKEIDECFYNGLWRRVDGTVSFIIDINIKYKRNDNAIKCTIAKQLFSLINEQIYKEIQFSKLFNSDCTLTDYANNLLKPNGIIYENVVKTLNPNASLHKIKLFFTDIIVKAA